MSTPVDALAESLPETRADASARLRRTRPFYWSVRRELWEHRELYWAPMIAAGVLLLGGLLSLGHVHTATVVGGFGDARPTEFALPAMTPQLFAAGVILATTLIVAFFYCLGALNSERRDRSILFWKSLPVSDLTTVLSKATIPLIVLPVITFLVTAAAQLVILGLMAVSPWPHLAAHPAAWDQLTLPWILRMEAYLLVVTPIWYAPVWGWLLLVSAWSRRGTFPLAVLAPLAVCVVERMALGTSHAWSLLLRRLSVFSAFSSALSVPPSPDRGPVLPQMDPLGFASDLEVWAGVLFACACLAAAVWLRRRREPI